MKAVEFSAPVRRSLLSRELLLGVPQAGLMIVFLLAVVFCYMLRFLFMAVPVLIFYIVMRIATRKDPYQVDIMIEHIQQPDLLIG